MVRGSHSHCPACLEETPWFWPQCGFSSTPLQYPLCYNCPFPKHLPNQVYLQVVEWNSEGNNFSLRIGSGFCDPFPCASTVPMRCCRILLKPFLELDSLISDRVDDRSLKHQSRNGSHNEDLVNGAFPTFTNRDDMKQTIALCPTIPHKREFQCKNIRLQRQYLPKQREQGQRTCRF